MPAGYLPGVQKWQSVRDVPALSAPVMIQHGTADQLIPIQQGEALANVMRDAGLDVMVHRITNATHNNLAGQPGYQDRIGIFLAQVLAE